MSGPDGLNLNLGFTYSGKSSANFLTGGRFADELIGGGGNDTLSGGDGADSLNGSAGTDSMRGGAGNDTYYVDSVQDKAIETVGGNAGGFDIVYSRVSFTLGDFVETLRMIPGSGAVNGTGNALNNEIWGTSSINTLRGLAVNDTFDGGSGADVLIGGAGNDVFKFGSPVTSNQAVRDRIMPGDNAVAFEKPGNAPGDKIDLSMMDGNTTLSGQQHLKFGTSTGVDCVWALDSGTDTLIRANLDNDAAVEFELAIADGSVKSSAYTSADFLL